MKNGTNINYVKKDLKATIYMSVLLVVYKMFLEIGFWFLIQQAYQGLGRYHFEISIWKWFLGNVLCAILFVFLPDEKKRPSSFFLKLIYLLIIIPMAVILGFSNENASFYILTCIGFAIVEWIVRLVDKEIGLPDSNLLTKCLIWGFYFSIILVLVGIYKSNGMFTLEALNIYNVYNVRRRFKLNKYVGYIFEWQYTVIIPFLIVRFLQKREYIKSLTFIGLQFVLYLYAGQKGILFIIPLTLFVYFVSKLKKFKELFITAFCGGTVIFVIGGFASRFLNNLFDLFVRRVLLLPAWLKYLYFDFFQTNETMGLANTLWGKFLGVFQPYKEGIGYIISDAYFGLPEVNSNTGFIAEGIYRFGNIGVILVFLVLAFILLALDMFAQKNTYEFSVCLGLFSIVLLNDGAIIDPLIFGHLLILVMICLVYNQKYDKKEKRNERTIIKKN